MARAIVEATAHFDDAELVAKVSRGWARPCAGQEIGSLDAHLAERGW